MCDEISRRIVVHVSGISTLNPEFIYRNVWKAIHTYQPTCRRKSARLTLQTEVIFDGHGSRAPKWFPFVGYLPPS